MVRINLLPVRETLRRRELKQLGFVAAGVLAAVVAVAVITYFVLSGNVSSLRAEQATLQKKLDDLKKKNAEINADKAEIARLQRQLDTVNRLTQVRETPAPFMAAVAKAIPDEVWLTSLSETGKGFTLTGEGVDNTVVVNFVQRLQQVALDKDKRFFADVRLVNIVRQTSGGRLGAMNFTIVGAMH